MELANALTNVFSMLPAPVTVMCLALGIAIIYACVADWRAQQQPTHDEHNEYDHEYEEDIYD